MTEAAVRFQGVTKRFGEFTAVADLDLEVPRGTIFGLLGQNGAGKTTSLRMLMNVFAPDQGRVEVLGETMNEGLKARLGYLPEERGLYKKMRLRELLRFFGRIKGRDTAFLDPRIERWLERMGLSGWIDRRVEELSKGMAQKVQFVVTVLHEPELVVLDEPFSGLDPVNRDVLRDVVLELRRGGATILFSTHVMEQAEALCDRLVLLHRGRTRLAGTVDEVRRREGREAAFVRIDATGSDPYQGLPGVAAASVTGREAELTLADGADTDALLHELTRRGSVRRFEVRAPSLHEIFKRVVGEAS
ncbi:MAG TPA: ATP-binding cassette domain-containing protein [Planctomycetota bacterium]|jgi:ABC-2 type transport system ATP-binding protein|nr:ATP-binding cassette domain-containing protein [Planctomycetota bacterium]